MSEYFIEVLNKNKVIDKLISWSLYQTWKWSDKKRKAENKGRKGGITWTK